MRLQDITHAYPIVKMHGCGNDFVVFMDPGKAFDAGTAEVRRVVSTICRRNFGVGSDGLIAIMPSRTRDAVYRMKFFNPDGSDAEMCGNGIRCLAKYLADNKEISVPTEFAVDTDAGRLVLDIRENSRAEAVVRVNMGVPETRNPDQVVAEPDDDGIVRVSSNGVHDLIYVGMGNPHVVKFTDDPRPMALQRGPLIEKHTAVFPQKTNVEFARVDTEDEITMFVWERGAGETLACGTGACATFVAAVLDGRAGKKATVHLLGGDLVIEWDGKGSPVYMTGPARNVFEIMPETIDTYLIS